MSADDLALLLERRAARYSARTARDLVSEADQMVVFVRAGASYAVRLEALASIHRLSALVPLPGVAPTIAGLAGVEGRILTVHDIGSFAKPARPVGAEAWVLVCRGDPPDTGLLADGVTGLRPVIASTLSPPPISLDAVHDCFAGFTEDGVGCLALDALFRRPDFFDA